MEGLRGDGKGVGDACWTTTKRTDVPETLNKVVHVE